MTKKTSKTASRNKPAARAASSAKSKSGRASTATKAKPTNAKPAAKAKVATKKATTVKATTVKAKTSPVKAVKAKSPSRASVSQTPPVSKAPEKLPGFLGLSAKYASSASARVHIIPCPYEYTTSYGKGTSNGPKAILEASQEVELFDDELWTEPFKVGVHTTDLVTLDKVEAGATEPFQSLYDVVKPLVDNDKFPLILGGEHSLTLGAVRACAERFKDLSVLQVGAHCDLRPSYDGNPYSHASIGYRLYENLPKPLITQVGIRNVSWQEARWMETESPKINIFWARMQDKWNFNEIVNTLSDNVYLTIDVDCLDSSIMPSTGAPEPGGMHWYQLMELIKHLCVRKNVVGADIVELAPIAGLHAPDFLVAKLAYKLIGYRFALELGVTKKYV